MADKVVINGRPVPFARPGHRDGRRFTPAAYKAWRGLASETMRFVGKVPLLEGPVSVRVMVDSDRVLVEAHELDPAAGWRRPKGVRGDLDNYVKAVLDAMQDAGWIIDDRQVFEINAEFYERDKTNE